jgi:arginase family enzyme
MYKLALLTIVFFLSTFSPDALAQNYRGNDGKVRVSIIKLPYSGARNVTELSPGPSYLAGDSLLKMLANTNVINQPEIRLSAEEEKEYGSWHRLAMANAHLAEMVSESEKDLRLPISFLSNCNGLMGMLGGLQRSGPGKRPLRVGLIWIDAHGDFNTPETTLSGMLGGMPVAISTGLCLDRIRQESGLEIALPTSYVTMVGVRDLDPLEQELVDKHNIEQISVEEIRNRSPRIMQQMNRIAALVDKIYIHIDIDVLDPREVTGHSLAVKNGPTSLELADVLRIMFSHPKVAAFGIASYPYGRDDDGLSEKAVHNLVKGVLAGVQDRPIEEM